MPAPINHKVISFFHLRDQLAQAAELASDKASGEVDLAKVPAQLRSTLTAIAGGDSFTTSSLSARLDTTLNDIDKLDIGKNDGRGVPATGGCGSRTGAEERIAGFRREHGTTNKPQSALSSFLANITGRRKLDSNLILDPGERQRLVASASPGMNAMLALLDANAGAPSPYLKHFPSLSGVKVTTEVSATHPMTARFHADPGATKDLASVMIKNLDTGAWSSGKVNADGSYDLDVGRMSAGGESELFAIWFETKGGEKFCAGELGNFWLENATHALSRHVVDAGSPLRGRPE